MLTEIAIGDAYGAGFEFATKERLAQIPNDLTTYYKHNLPGAFPAGSYTDDTQMSIAIVELMLSGKAFTVENVAEKFVECYKRDPRPGYSFKLQEIMDGLETGAELRAKIVPNSAKCGAAMRSVPIGLCASKTDIMTFCQTQASVTHNTTSGIVSSQAVALTAHYYRYRCAETLEVSLPEFLNLYLPAWNWTGWKPKTYVSTSAEDVVCSAISAVERNTKMSELLKECVDYTGDVDSVSAIALGLASVNPKYANDLPLGLYDGLEKTAYGHQFLAGLDRKLSEFNGYIP